MVSSVTEGHVKKLRQAGYLSDDIAHRLPDEGQLIPTPRPHERKVVSGRQAECGGAMVGKMPNVTWLEGSFVETIKGWQSGWFYITEPRDPTWVAAPEF